MEEWKFQMIDMIMLVESAEMLYKEITEKTLNFVLTNCVFDSCKGIEDCKAICYFVEFTRQANIEIRDNVFCNIKNDDFAYCTFVILPIILLAILLF